MVKENMEHMETRKAERNSGCGHRWGGVSAVDSLNRNNKGPRIV